MENNPSHKTFKLALGSFSVQTNSIHHIVAVELSTTPEEAAAAATTATTTKVEMCAPGRSRPLAGKKLHTAIGSSRDAMHVSSQWGSAALHLREHPGPAYS